jgi:hypothetical protein
MEKTVIFNYTSEVVGICGDQIIIEASIDDDEYGMIDKSIVLKKDQYTKLMDKWLEEKKDYCERYGYCCGEGYILGHFDGELSYVEVLGEEYLDCRSVEFTVDLEHG